MCQKSGQKQNTFIHLTKMIDTLNMWMDRADLRQTEPFDVLPYLTDVTQKTNQDRGIWYSGKCGNYAVNLYSYGVLFVGSLAKYYFGDNLHTLTHRTLKEAVNMLSDKLHIPMNDANINRMDIAAILPMKYPINRYYPYLGAKAHFKRYEAYSDTLYYKTQKKWLAFYDKTKEALISGVNIPECLQGANLLRYELRFENRCKKQLDGKNKVSDLFKPDFYKSLVKNWLNEFKTIQKNNINTIDMENIKTPKDAINLYICEALQMYGQTKMDEFINMLKTQKVFSDRQNLYKVKRDLNKMMQSSIGKNELLAEMENNISDVAMFHL